MAKKKIVFLAFMMTLMAGLLGDGKPAAAQEQSSKVIPNSIWVGADGKFESDPDTALVQFGISAQEEKQQDATQKATQAAEQVRQLLRSNGIDPSEAQISRFTTQPVYDYKNAKRKLVGYRVDANISIKLKDFSKIGPIAQGISGMDVTDTSISYQLDNIDAAKIKAVQDASRRAHSTKPTPSRRPADVDSASYRTASVDTFGAATGAADYDEDHGRGRSAAAPRLRVQRGKHPRSTAHVRAG